MSEFNISGTYIWYYCICKREVWLLAHGMEADQQNDAMRIGNMIHENAYERSKKELEFGDSKFDVVKRENGRLVVGEVKKSSKFLESARMQLLFYLLQLEESGVEAEGELLFPEEKKKETVLLNSESRMQLRTMIEDIRAIAMLDTPPLPEKKNYCKKCAYAEFCWA